MALAGTIDLQAPAAGTRHRRWRSVRLLLKKKIAVVAIVLIATFYFCGIFAPLISPYGPNESPTPLTRELRNAGPSADHWFGTDVAGRDLMTRVFYAARTTVIFTLVVLVTGGVVLGLGLGLLAGYRGGWVDTVIMRVGEVLAGIPTLTIVLALTAAFRQRISGITFSLADNTSLGVDDARAIVQFTILVGASVPFAWVGSSRIVRAQALSIRESTFVEAAEGIGASTSRILWRHIFPGVLPLFLVGLSSAMASIALAEVALSFLGLGITEPASSFGTLIADGANPRVFELFPHLLLAPSIPVVLFFLSWNLLGDALVDLVNPRATREA